MTGTFACAWNSVRLFKIIICSDIKKLGQIHLFFEKNLSLLQPSAHHKSQDDKMTGTFACVWNSVRLFKIIICSDIKKLGQIHLFFEKILSLLQSSAHYILQESDRNVDCLHKHPGKILRGNLMPGQHPNSKNFPWWGIVTPGHLDGSVYFLWYPYYYYGTYHFL